MEGIDLTKSKNKKCIVCHFCYFKHGFKFQKSFSNGCHDLLMMNPDIKNIAIITVKGVDHCCTIHVVSKADAIHLLDNSVHNGLGFTMYFKEIIIEKQVNNYCNNLIKA